MTSQKNKCWCMCWQKPRVLRPNETGWAEQAWQINKAIKNKELEQIYNSGDRDSAPSHGMCCIRHRHVFALRKMKATELNAPCCGVIINHYWMPLVAPWSGWVPFLHLDNGWAGLNNDLCCLEAFFCRTDFSVFGLAEIAEESRGLNPSLHLRAREWERWDAGLHFNSSSGVIHLHISSKSTLLLASG